MKEAGRSKHSGTVVKKNSSSGCLTIKKKVGDSVGEVSGFSDSSSRNLSRPSRDKKRSRVVESDSESSDYSLLTTRQKVDKLHKGSAVHKGAYFENREFETEKRVSNGLDVFEFDEYDGFDYSRIGKDANRGRHIWNSYEQRGDEMESGNDCSRPTHDARSRSEMKDDDFDLPLFVLSKKYRSNQPNKLQGKNGVVKVMVNENKQKEAEDQKEPKPRVVHKKKSHKNGDHRVGGDEESDDTNSKEKGELKSLKPMVEKSSKEVNESDTVTQSKSNSRVETLKKPENDKKVKEKEGRVKRGSGTEKQILREKIKNMLVDAGWSIDYRPRKNKNYMDAIYTNTAGTAYWSIIKAYETLQREEEGNTEDGGNFTPLPVEKLGKLERQTQKKMEKELEKERKHEGGNRNGKRSMEDTVTDEEELNLNSHGRKSRRLARSTLLVRDSNKVLNSENDGSALYSGKRSILAWLIDSQVVNMSEHVEYMNGRRTRVLQKGRITRDGIHCGCCNKILTVSKFEQHSGSKLCNPFQNIFLESGKSLMQCQIDAWSKLGELEQKGFYRIDVDGDDPNDDTCSVCGDGGDLICCDGCPSTFHQSCLDIEMLPEDDWLCPNCSCKYCKMAGGNCTKEGGKTEASLLTCCLCHKKYHESCRPEPHEHNSLDLSFCGQECHEVYIRLQKVVGVKQELDAGFSWSLIHRSDSLTDGEGSVSHSQRVEWNCMLGVAMAVMDECFLPFTDSRTGINLIRNVVFNCGSNLSRLNYSGFYTAILERGDEVVCAASIRIHGTQLAEMPFIGTRHIYRRQGMCRRLLSAIESALSALQVDKLIIPAVAEHMNTWTDVFGFQPLKESHKQQIKSMNMNMLVFPGTDMLQKPLVKQVGNNTVEVDDVSAMSKKPKLISSKVENATTDSSSQEFCVPLNNGCSVNVIKETVPVNSPVKDESPCEPKLQQSEKESDSTRSQPNSKIGEIAVQNGNGTNKPKEGSCGSERNGTEKERGISGAVSESEAANDLSGLHLCNNTPEVDDRSALSENSELISSNGVELSDKTAITDSGSQVVGVPSDDGCSLDAIHPINSSVEDCERLPEKESDSILSHADSKVAMRNDDQISQLPTHVHDPSHDTIQLSKKESFSLLDVQTKGNNTVKVVDGQITMSKKSDLISSNVVELSDKNATTDSSVARKEALPLDSFVKDESPCDPELQLPGKESDAIRSHSDSRVDEIAEKDCNESNPKESSCGIGSEMNRKENGRGAVSDSKAANANGLHSCNDLYSVNSTPSVELDALSRKSELIISCNEAESNDKTATTDAGFDDKNCCLDGSKETLPANSPVNDEMPVPVSANKLSSSGELDRNSHSDSKVDEIVVQNDTGTDPKGNNAIEVDEGSALSEKPELISFKVAEFSDKSTAMNSDSGEVGNDGCCLDASKVKDTLPISPPVKDDIPPVAVAVSVSAHRVESVPGSSGGLDRNSGDDAHFDSNVKESSTPDKITQEPVSPSSGSKLQRPEKESNSICSHSGSKVDGIAVQTGNGHDAVPSENESFSCVDVQTDSMVLETDRKEDEIGIPGAVSDSEAVNGLSDTMEVDDVSALSKKQTELSDKNATTDSGVPLDDGSSLHATVETLPVSPPGEGESPCEPQPQLQLPGKESDSIHSYSNSKVDEMELQNGHGTNPLPAQVHDAIPSDIQCQSHKQVPPAPTHDEADVQNGHGTNPLQDQVHDVMPSGIPCESHIQVPASSSEPNLQQPGKECVSIHSHSVSKVNEIDVQSGNGTPRKGVNGCDSK